MILTLAFAIGSGLLIAGGLECCLGQQPRAPRIGRIAIFIGWVVMATQAILVTHARPGSPSLPEDRGGSARLVKAQHVPHLPHSRTIDEELDELLGPPTEGESVYGSARKASPVYHREGCSYLGLGKHLREWPSAEAAEQDGRRRCSRCFADHPKPSASIHEAQAR